MPNIKATIYCDKHDKEIEFLDREFESDLLIYMHTAKGIHAFENIETKSRRALYDAELTKVLFTRYTRRESDKPIDLIDLYDLVKKPKKDKVDEVFDAFDDLLTKSERDYLHDDVPRGKKLLCIGRDIAGKYIDEVKQTKDTPEQVKAILEQIKDFPRQEQPILFKFITCLISAVSDGDTAELTKGQGDKVFGEYITNNFDEIMEKGLVEMDSRIAKSKDKVVDLASKKPSVKPS